jgi:hypothetical protein
MRPYDLGEELDYLILGTMRSPGVVKLNGHNRIKQWDNKAAKGTTGASSALNGDPIGTFEATFYLVDDGSDPDSPTDFDLWEDFQKLIESTTNGPKPVALPIYHPDLARNRFTEVVNGGVDGMVHDDKGGATVKVKFQEHKPPKPKPPAKAQSKPGAAGGPPGTQKPDPNAAAKAELGRLVTEAKKP